MFDLSSLLSPRYWFDLTPTSLTGLTERILLVFFLVVFAVGLFFRLIERRKRFDRFKSRAWQRLSRVGLTMGVFGWLILFFGFEQIRLFGARFWFLFWLISVLVWLFFIWRDYYRVAPRERRLEEQRRQREKYLPRKK